MFVSKHGSRGFTLVELMVSVSVISVLTAIAVPNLLRSRIAANETAAIGSLRAVATAQHMFRRSDYDNDGVREFGYYWDLSKVWMPNARGWWIQQNLNFIDAGLARAHRWWTWDVWPTVPRCGYYFHDAYGYINIQGQWQNNGQMVGRDWVMLRFGCTATPAAYEGTGVNIFAIDDRGIVWQKDGAAEEDYVNYDYLWYLFDDQTMRARDWIMIE